VNADNNPVTYSTRDDEPQFAMRWTCYWVATDPDLWKIEAGEVYYRAWEVSDTQELVDEFANLLLISRQQLEEIRKRKLLAYLLNLIKLYFEGDLSGPQVYFDIRSTTITSASVWKTTLRSACLWSTTPAHTTKWRMCLTFTLSQSSPGRSNTIQTTLVI
jgi:hypothetical protein